VQRRAPCLWYAHTHSPTRKGGRSISPMAQPRLQIKSQLKKQNWFQIHGVFNSPAFRSESSGERRGQRGGRLHHVSAPPRAAVLRCYARPGARACQGTRAGQGDCVWRDPSTQGVCSRGSPKRCVLVRPEGMLRACLSGTLARCLICRDALPTHAHAHTHARTRARTHARSTVAWTGWTQSSTRLWGWWSRACCW